ncbi:MAG: Zn-dependent exopeptidase M28 [Bacteroidetes bacterium]|nr:Zn-dependent exopeptidase M28 [Bacteroidota bacterium]
MSRIVLLLILFSVSKAQDSLYARYCLKNLCSKKMFGRGYTHGGLKTAEKFITTELKKNNALPYFKSSYTQSFFHNIVVFTKEPTLHINNTPLKFGTDFIITPSSASCNGHYTLLQKDSATYISNLPTDKIMLSIQQKLTFSASTKQENVSVFEILKTKIREQPITIDVTLKSKLINNFESKNIACTIKGNSNSDSFIVFTAHYDHLGGVGKTNYFPGANDNASGVSLLLNLIKHFSKNKPKHNLIFIFFAGEEAGLLGSKHFIESQIIELKKIKFLINLDLLGTGGDGAMIVNAYQFEKQFNLLNKINTENSYLPILKKRGKAKNSDHYWFTENGVPSFFIYTMGGSSAYHDIYDTEANLPLTKFKEAFKLLVKFEEQL